LRNKSAKLLVHVHELESEIKRTIGNLNQFSDNIDILIAASGMVRDNLLHNYSIPANKIEVIYEFTKKLNPKIKSKKKEEVFEVGGSGKFGHRKGTDLFIQTARYLNDHYPQLKIEFTWVGLVPENDKASLELELNKIDLNNRINFVGEAKNPAFYFEKFDVFLMTSREDPFPLVCIEAGMLGIPIICFDKATGVSEIIKDKGGFTVPYLNIEVMAEKIIFYMENPQIYMMHSKFNQAEFSKFTAKTRGPIIYNLLAKSIKYNRQD
jgi:glycosyltransferase involved in cell wall biosynthesis